VVIRLFFFLLVLANLLFYAWTQGHFGATDDSHEPQRVAQQLNAEKLRILRNAQAPAPTAKRDETSCRVVSGLNVADAETLKVAVEAAGGETNILPLAEPTLHLVVITGLAGKAAADKKAAELTRFGVEGHRIVALEGDRHEIILGSFSTEIAAREFLQGLAKRGIRSARLDARQQPTLKARAEIRAPASTLQQQLPKLIAPYADATIGECAP
jgi:hypothetical protein